ncbi:MAG: flavin reductase [Dehalococcoidia bacterium]|nr:flavin reductase [Dehalococcoidia bacterium]
MQDDLIDSREFRDVMGRFATGVTVVTTRVGHEQRGMTANAVTSLSLHPPMLLVCVDRSASMHPFLEVAEAFAVNILAAEQKPASEFFARHSEQSAELGGFPHHAGTTGVPLLDGALAAVECRITERYSGGDHTIVLGRVVAIHSGTPEGAPLVFFGGKYRAIADAV